MSIRKEKEIQQKESDKDQPLYTGRQCVVQSYTTHHPKYGVVVLIQHTVRVKSRRRDIGMVQCFDDDGVVGVSVDTVVGFKIPVS